VKIYFHILLNNQILDSSDQNMVNICHHHLLACYLFIMLSTTFIICYSFHTTTTSTSIKYDHTMKSMMMSTSDRSDHDILLRALKGEVVERTPVWLMRQVNYNHLKDD